MSFVHGKDTFVSVNGKDLSPFGDASELERSPDISDVTTYGKQAHVYAGGLLDGKFTMSGKYDNSQTSGPGAVLEPLLGQTVPFIRRAEGTGVGKPQHAGNVVVGKYNESSPVADFVTWSCEFTISDTLARTIQ